MTIKERIEEKILRAIIDNCIEDVSGVFLSDIGVENAIKNIMQEVVFPQVILAKSMPLDEIQKRVDELLDSETKETLTEWININR